MGSPADTLPALASTTLDEIDRAVAKALGPDTLTQRNAPEIQRIVSAAIPDPVALLNELVMSALSSDAALDRLTEAFDEKEFWLRIFLKTADNYSLRLHVFLPASDGKVVVETVHSHRRYMISTLLANAYTVYSYVARPDKTVSLEGTHTVPAGTCYTIGPETIHAIGNHSDQHTVSLIVRGNAVTNQIRFFDRETGRLAEYESQRPVATLGKTPEEMAMSRKDYLRDRLTKLAAESSRASHPSR